MFLYVIMVSLKNLLQRAIFIRPYIYIKELHMSIIAKNPTAKHNYTIENTIDAGIVLSRNRNKIDSFGKS